MATDLINNRFFYANAGSIRSAAVETAKLSVMYPYPPKDCKTALAMSQLLDNELNSSLQSNSEAYKQAAIALKSQFDNYVSKAKCKEKVTDAETEAFKKEIKDAQDAEEQKNKSTQTISTSIILAVVGVLIVATALIIMKRRKAKA